MHPKELILRTLELGAYPLKNLTRSSAIVLPPYTFLVPSSEVGNAIRNIDHVFLSKDYERVGGFEPRGVVVDLGAYAGFFSMRAARHSSLVVAVEANPIMCHYLRANAKLNAPGKVKSVCAAVDAEKGWGTLFLADDMVNSSLLISYVEEFSSLRGTVRVPRLTLEDVFRVGGITRADLVKIDVEGLEERLVRASSDILRPGIVERVVVEVHAPICKAKSVADELSRKYKVAIITEDELPGQVFVYAWAR